MSKNKVTQEQIAKLISESKIDVTTVQEKCTVVTVTLKSGFILSESSACVDKANYNEEIGARCCMERIERKLWELEGYALQKELAEIDENCAVITKAEWKEYQKQAYSQVFETLTNRLEKYYSQYYSTMAVIMQAITDEIQTIVLDKYGEHLNVEQEIKELKQRSVKDFADKLKAKTLDKTYQNKDFNIHISDIYKMIEETLKEYEE